MKKIIFIFVFLLIVILILNIFYKIQYNYELTRFKNNIDNILNNWDKSNFTLFDKIMAVNDIFVDNFDKNWVSKEIDNMTQQLKLKIGSEGNPEIIMNIINKFFFQEYGFEFDNKANNFLSGKYSENPLTIDEWINLHSLEKILKNKKGICLSLSLIYLILAEKLNLPVYGILIPGHMFVRYESVGRTGINVETTFKGKEFYDYFSYAGIDILNKDKLIYGKKLNKKQVIAAYLNNIGIIFELKNEFQKSKIIYTKIFEILPDLPEVYNNMAFIYIKENNLIKAEETLKKVIEIYPDNLIANTNLGILYFNEKRFNMAEIYLKKSLNLYPDNKKVQKLFYEIKQKRK